MPECYSVRNFCTPIRLGRGGVKDLPLRSSHQRSRNGSFATPLCAPYVGEVLEQTLGLIFNDVQLFNRFRTLLRKQDKARGENGHPENENERLCGGELPLPGNAQTSF